MPNPSARSVVHSILSANPDLSADEVIKRATARGLKADPSAIRKAVHNVRSELKRMGGAPAAARSGPVPTAPRPAPVAARETSVPQPAGGAADLSAVLGNVALVNQMVGTCGGVENVRQAAEAVRSCGGVDAFLQHLDLVAGIRGAG